MSDITNNNTVIVQNGTVGLSTGALVGLIIGLVIICTIIIVVVYWCIRLRHFYLSQRHTKMYDPDVMIQPGQPRPSIISGAVHFPSTGLPEYRRPSSSLYKSTSQSKPPVYPGDTNDPADVGKRPPLYPNLNQDGYLNNINNSNNNNNNFINETPLKHTASIGGGGGSVNAAVNLSPVEKRNSDRFSQGLQSPSWTDHHYYNTHHFNSDGLPFNYSAYHQHHQHHQQDQPSIDETHINHSFHIDPLGATPSFSTASTANSVASSSAGAAAAAAAAASAFASRSRLKSIAFISQISAFGLKNKRRFSHLTQKSTKVKDKTTSTTAITSRSNLHGKGKHSSDGQSNPLSVTEIYGNEYEGYYNANMQSDNLDFNTMESLDNDYFLYSLQAAIFHGLIPSSQSNNNNNNQYTFHDTDKFQFPYTRTSIIHEEFDPSFGEDLGLGNSRVSSTLSAYSSSSNRNSKTFSPDFMNISNASNASSNSRFKFPPPGPPVAGWVNQFILHTGPPENTTILTTIPPPPSTRSERRLSHSQHQQQQQKTSSSLINSPVNNSSVTVIDIADLSTKMSITASAASAALVGTMKSSPGNRCISSVPPSPQHIPFQFVHSSRSLGLTSSSIIPRRHAAKKYSFQESPIISNTKNSVVPKLDLLVKSNNSSIVLTNTAVNNDTGLFMLFNENTNTTNITNNTTNNDDNNPTTNNNNNNDNKNSNEDDEMPSQSQQSPSSYTDGNYCDSGYQDSVIIAEQSLLSSLSAEHSLDLQLSPVLLISENQSTIDLLNNNNNTNNSNNNNNDDHNIITPDDNMIPLSKSTDTTLRDQLTEDSTNTNTANLSKSLQFTYSKLDTPKPLPISSPTSPLISSASSLSNNSTSTMASSTNSNTVMLLRDNAAGLTTAYTLSFPPHIFSSVLPWDARSSCRSPFGFYWRVCLADVVAQPYPQISTKRV
uniref:Uncharacterized protein n=1 Tax=Trichobilharzia regenti TaxID=157069 RepID=A0AA85J2F5_TRIRE|nr:unnamed protein product [Trichobilharzia regenti]